jgi:rubredoxin
MCLICGWTYDESVGDPDSGIAPGTTWDKIPADWSCPECGVKKSEFEMVRI